MLCFTLGIDFDIDESWDEKKELFKISGKIVGTRNTTQSVRLKNADYTTVLRLLSFCSDGGPNRCRTITIIVNTGTSPEGVVNGMNSRQRFAWEVWPLSASQAEAEAVGGRMGGPQLAAPQAFAVARTAAIHSVTNVYPCTQVNACSAVILLIRE